METIGILGWLWPDTTAKFYLEIVHRLARENTTQHPPLLIWNTALPKELERRFLLTWGGIEEYKPYLIEGARALEAWWAKLIVIPCNSVHVLIEDLRSAVNIPIISIIEETLVYIQHRNLKNIGIVSTSVTSENRLYEKLFNKECIPYKSVNPLEQKTLNQMIYNIVRGQTTSEDHALINDIVISLKNKWAKNILLACTDLQSICTWTYELPIFDTMNILAWSVISRLSHL
jgi:aspartate racemase